MACTETAAAMQLASQSKQGFHRRNRSAASYASPTPSASQEQGEIRRAWTQLTPAHQTDAPPSQRTPLASLEPCCSTAHNAWPWLHDNISSQLPGAQLSALQPQTHLQPSHSDLQFPTVQGACKSAPSQPLSHLQQQSRSASTSAIGGTVPCKTVQNARQLSIRNVVVAPSGSGYRRSPQQPTDVPPPQPLPPSSAPGGTPHA